MLKNITIGQYLNVDSLVHRLDPRGKLLLVNVFMIMLFMMPGMLSYLPIAAVLSLAIFLGKIPFAKILKGLKPIVILLSIAFFLNIFMIKGETEPLFSWWIFTVYPEGLERAVFMALRLILLVVATSILTLTTSPNELTDAFEFILTPLKLVRVPTHEIAMMMTIALRFIPTLLSETEKIMKAQMSRGADFESGGIMQRAKALIPLLIPLFVSAFRRADELALAMEARCYHGGEGRTRLKQFKFKAKDLVAAIIFVGALVLAYFVGKVW